MKSIIHIDQTAIKKNRKTGSKLPVVTIKTYKSNKRVNEIEINGPSKLIYRPEKPLHCGATVWIETQSDIIVIK